MALLARRIDKALWLQTDIFKGEDVSADAITNCIKTKKNTLSTWKIKDSSSINEAILALASGANHIDTFDIIYLDVDFFENKNFKLDFTPGMTSVKDLVETHVDIINLDYKKLGIIASSIAEQFINNKVRRVTNLEIRKVLKEAIEKNRLSIEDLKISDASKEKIKKMCHQAPSAS